VHKSIPDQSQPRTNLGQLQLEEIGSLYSSSGRSLLTSMRRRRVRLPPPLNLHSPLYLGAKLNDSVSRLLDPACEACVAALGVIGCVLCLDSAAAAQLEQSVLQQLAGMSSNIVKTVQAEFCQFSTPTFAKATLKQSGGTSQQTATA